MTETETAPAPEAPARKPRKKPARSLWYNDRVGCLLITVGKEESGYWVDRMPHDGPPELRLYRLTKFAASRRKNDQPAYDVTYDDAAGTTSCDCLGAMAHPGTTCKHAAAVALLAAAGLLK